MYKYMRIIAGILTVVIVFSLTACSSSKEKTVIDYIKESPSAKMELPDGKSTYVDSEIASLRSFADLRIQASPLEPSDGEDDWIYRIVFNPTEKVTGTNEIIVSFHKDYVQINTEYYLPADGVSYDSIHGWTECSLSAFLSEI